MTWAMAKRTQARTSKPGADSGSGPLDDRVRMLILCGPDNYLRTEKLHALRAAVEAKRGDVDVIHFDGQTAAPADVLDEARSLGLMQQYKIIVVEDADEFVKRGENRRSMERYAQNPAEDATLVLRSPTWNAGKLDQMVEAVGRVVRCEAPDPAQALAFCIQRCEKRYGCTIDRRAAALLVERLGTGLARLDAELSRLSLMTEKEGDEIDIDLVRRSIPLSREDKAWEVQDALLTGDPPAALGKVIELMTVSRHDPVPLFFSMIDLSRKVYAASRLLAEGRQDGSIARAARIWGENTGTVLAAARRMAPPAAAALMRDAIRAAQRPRQSLGTPELGIEILALRFVSELQPR